MNRGWGLLVLALLLYSCNYFETKKIDAETLFEEEIATINWEEVDEYPLFASCDETASKQGQLVCFHTKLSAKVATVINDSVSGVMQAVSDTVYMQMKIDTTGRFTLQSLEMDTITRAHLPSLEQWLTSALKNIDPIAPATKKGIPVATIYTLPVVLVTD